MDSKPPKACGSGSACGSSGSASVLLRRTTSPLFSLQRDCASAVRGSACDHHNSSVRPEHGSRGFLIALQSSR